MISTRSCVRLYTFDCETDDKDLNNTNITEMSLRDAKTRECFTVYIKKSEFAKNRRTYEKPTATLRHSFLNAMISMNSFVELSTSDQDTAFFIGANVHNWDKQVLQLNCARFHTPELKNNIRFFDLLQLAQNLDYPTGITQYRLAMSLGVRAVPANLHRARADVAWAKEIQNVFFRSFQTADRMEEFNTAIQSADPELAVATLIKKYDPLLVANESLIKRLRAINELESRPRELSVVVLYDVETTGLFSKIPPNSHCHYYKTPQIAQIGAKVLSPFEDPSILEETFSSLVNSGVPMPESATRIHGITNEMLQEAPDLLLSGKACIYG